MTQFVLLCTFFNVLFADVHVKGYYKKNGTYVQPHYRSNPNYTKSDNWSTYGNINPYTGKKGTKRYDNYNNYGKNYNENTQTNVTNGRYLSSTLLCNDGYKDINGQCNKLPNVTNGRYLSSTLLCNDGYKDIGGQCK